MIIYLRLIYLMKLIGNLVIRRAKFYLDYLNCIIGYVLYGLFPADVTDRPGVGTKRSRDTDIGTDSYRQACHHLKIPPVKIAQDQLWCKHITLRHVGLGPTDIKALAYALSVR